jgi:hypothetical protein
MEGTTCAPCVSRTAAQRCSLPVVEEGTQGGLDGFEDVAYLRFSLITLCVHIPQLAFHRPVKRLKRVREFLGLVERGVDRIRDAIRVPANVLQLLLACGDLDKGKVGEGECVDALDDPGGVVVEGDGDLAFEGADDAGGDVGSGEGGVDDEGGDVDGGVVGGRRRGRGWCGGSPKEGGEWHGPRCTANAWTRGLRRAGGERQRGGGRHGKGGVGRLWWAGGQRGQCMGPGCAVEGGAEGEGVAGRGERRAVRATRTHPTSCPRRPERVSTAASSLQTTTWSCTNSGVIRSAPGAAGSSSVAYTR